MAKATKKAKSDRCWPGYEPVKGKKQNSQGSCRPTAKSKLSDSEKSFRHRRDKQLDDWREKHPGSPRKAAQHLKAPRGARKGKTK